MFTRPGILFCIPFCNRLPRPLAPSAPPAPAFFGPLGGCGPQHGTTVVTCGDTVPNKQNKGLLKSGKSGTKQIAVVNSTSRCRLKMFKACWQNCNCRSKESMSESMHFLSEPTRHPGFSLRIPQTFRVRQ